MAADPQLNQRNMFVEMEHPGIGPVTFTNTPIKMSRTQGGAKGVQPDAGEHTTELLSELGLDAARIEALRAKSVVA